MKDLILKGHPLTENESKEVKGGAWYAIKVVTEPHTPPTDFPCDICGHTISKFMYNANTQTYTSVCFECGCEKEVKIEE